MQAMSMCVLDEPMYVDWNKVEWPAFSDRDFLGLFMVAAMKCLTCPFLKNTDWTGGMWSNWSALEF
jgi:hypothetical protein